MHFFSTRRPHFNPTNDTWDLGWILEDYVKLTHTVHLVQVFQQLIIQNHTEYATSNRKLFSITYELQNQFIRVVSLH